MLEEGEDGDVVSRKDEKYMRALERLQVRVLSHLIIFLYCFWKGD